jgi:hypothetical protein
MFLSPEAQKAVDEANGQRNALREWHDRGPHLNDDGTYVIVPSAYYHRTITLKLTAKLKAQGFTFSPGACPQWERCTAYAARDGKVYSAEAWLRWAKDLFSEVWGKSEGGDR